MQVDPNTGATLKTIPVPTTPTMLTQWTPLPSPIAFFGGDFYLFTEFLPLSDGGVDYSRSAIVRFRPSGGMLVQVGGADGHVTGAGVSTCAPLQ